MLRGAQISGGSRAVELGLITLKKTKILGNLMIIFALSCLIILSINIYYQTGSFDNIYGVGIIGFLGLFLAFFYTAEPLKFSSRKGLGELTIFLTFGPLLTLGSFFAMSNTSIEISFQLLQNQWQVLVLLFLVIVILLII